MAKRLTPKQQAQRAEKALRELGLGTLSQADQIRLGHAIVGLSALDDEQARIKKSIETLLESFEKDSNTQALIAGLQALLEC